MIRRISLRKIEKPLEMTVRGDINWICQSFGLYEGSGKKNTAVVIFSRLLKKAGENHGVTTAELSDELNLSRVATLNQLDKLISAGFVIRDKTEYRLRSPNLTRTLREITKDMLRTIKDMEDIAGSIDDDLGLKKRRLKNKSSITDTYPI